MDRRLSGLNRRPDRLDLFQGHKHANLPSLYLGVVSTKGRKLNRIETTANTFNAVTGCFLRDDVQGNARLVLANWWWDQTGTKTEKAIGTATWTATVEYNGVRYPVTWAGQPSVTASTAIDIESDDIANLVAPSGAAIKVRVFGRCASGIPWSQLPNDTSVGDVLEYGTDILDKTMSGSPVMTNALRAFAPIALVAPTRKATVLIAASDSIADWFNDDYTGGQRDLTFGRCFGPQLAYINAGSYGDTTAAFIASHDRRVGLKRYCSHVLSEIGVNDLGNGNLAADIIPRLETIFAYFSDKKLKQTTITPKTNSTDAWMTTANQNFTTPLNLTSFAGGGASQRAILNAYKRSRSDVIEFADFFETGRDTGIYKADGTGGGRFTLDGLHPWKGNGASSWSGYAASGMMTPADFRR